MPRLTYDNALTNETRNHLKTIAPMLKCDPLDTNLLADLVLEAAEEKNYFKCGGYHFDEKRKEVNFYFYSMPQQKGEEICLSLNLKFAHCAELMPLPDVRSNFSKICIKLIALTEIISQANPYKIKEYDYESDKLIAKIESVTVPLGFQTDCNVIYDTILQIILESPAKKQLISEFFEPAKYFPISLIEIIQNYAGAINESSDNLAINKLPAGKCVSGDRDLQTEMHISCSEKFAILIADYFNKLESSSASFSVKENASSEEKNTDSPTYIIKIKNQVLLSAYFFGEMELKIKSYGKETLSCYQLKSNYLVELMKELSSSFSLLNSTPIIDEAKATSQKMGAIGEKIRNLLEDPLSGKVFINDQWEIVSAMCSEETAPLTEEEEKLAKEISEKVIDEMENKPNSFLLNESLWNELNTYKNELFLLSRVYGYFKSTPEIVKWQSKLDDALSRLDKISELTIRECPALSQEFRLK